MMNIQNLAVSFEKKQIIRCFSQRFDNGEIVSIIGPNGSGKSTVLKAVSKLIKKDRGSVYLQSKDMAAMSTKAIARQLAILMQSNDCPSSFTVKQLVSFGRIPHQKWYEATDANQSEVVDWAMAAAGVMHLATRTVMSLSGGERQKVWIATALAQEPKILFLDEPTTFLDICHQLEVMNLVVDLNREHGLSVVMVLHDLNQAAQFSHKIIAIKSGEVYACGKPEEVITERMLCDVYGVHAEIHYQKATQSLCVVPVSLTEDRRVKGNHIKKGEQEHAI